MSGAELAAALGSTAWGVALAVGPLAVLFAVFQVLFLRLPHREIVRIAIGTLVSSAGLFLFLLGVGIGFLPFGRAIGETLGALPAKWPLAPAGLVLGFMTTWGEPAVRILADQVDEASAGSIRRSLVLNAMCVGVAVAVAVAMLRIGYGIPLLYLLVPGYGLVLAIMWLCDTEFVAIAIDAGGVATGPLANTFLLALALGTAAGMGSENPLVEGLGLVSLIALAPILSVMAMGFLVRWKERSKES
ncbi:MAG TPA: DUF1538 domain-containing protein [Gammaproteobacteria bacterium]|nr:DUF1538 domain-containing protein [Gammaproteobacteria bacterium]